VSGNYRAISRSPAIFTKIRKFKVNFNLPNGKVVPMGCAGDHTVAQIKDQLWLIMKELGIFHENPGLEDKNLYSIKYVKDCDNYELYEEQQILYPNCSIAIVIDFLLHAYVLNPPLLHQRLFLTS
jgi:hypothetical protein